MDDISPPVRRMTYAELAEARDEAAGLCAELDGPPPPAALPSGAEVMSIRCQRRAERHRPRLRVIEGGRAQVIADIERLAGDLREHEKRLASVREALRQLLASLGPV